MSKKDKKKKKDKEPKTRLPKQIAGVPIGKELRDAVDPVLQWAGHPMVSEALSAALLAGVTALSGKKASSTGGKATGAAAGAAAGAGTGAAASVGIGKGATPIGLALAVAAGEIASRIVAAYEDGATPEKNGRRKKSKDAQPDE